MIRARSTERAVIARHVNTPRLAARDPRRWEERVARLALILSRSVSSATQRRNLARLMRERAVCPVFLIVRLPVGANVRRLALCSVVILSLSFSAHVLALQTRSSAPILFDANVAIERQKRRTLSSDVEERRDAVMRLGALGRSDAARAAAIALDDPDAKVRAAATSAVLALPADEAARLLIPLLRDRDEFVRREAAYALGRTKSQLAVEPLIESLLRDRHHGVRAAAAVALGEIGDRRAVAALVQSLNRRFRASGISGLFGRREPENEFVRRAAARSLGQIGRSEAVPALIAVLTDRRSTDDLRREAARALGSIGDPRAEPALRALLTARDPYLAEATREALNRLRAPGPLQPWRR